MSYLVMDVSVYNTVDDWNSVSNQIDGVIIRCGYRGYGSGNLVTDTSFLSHISGAISAGVPVGVYFFTQAINAQEGKEEADYVLNLIKDYRLSFPIFIDTENSGSSDKTGRADQISNNDRTAAVKAFCEEIVANGYSAGIYASDSWYNSKINQNELRDYYFWVAKYSSASPVYVSDYCGWQYTSSGNIDGVTDRVDLSHWYIEIGEIEQPEVANPVYYPIYKGNGGSLVNALTAIGCVDTSYTYRSKIARINRITNYTGSATQNITMLNMLKAGTLIDPDNGNTLNPDITAPVITIISNTCCKVSYSVIDNTELYSVKDNDIEQGVNSSYNISGEKGEVHTIIAEDINGNISTETITIVGHNYTESITNPTCTEQGYTTHLCDICEESYIDTYTDAIDHNYELKNTVPATCTEKGYKLFECTNCNDSYTEEIGDVLGHDYEVTEVVEPTCNSKGYKVHTCSRCGKSYKNEYTDILEHVWEIKRIIDPTCTEQGYTIYSCVNCNINKKEDYIDALGHDYEIIESSEPTCTENGYKTYKCTRCGNTYSENTEPPLGHFIDEDPIFEWNENKDGCKAILTCSRCNEIIELDCEISIKNKAQTCEEKGIIEYTASITYNDITYTNKIVEESDELGHQYEVAINIEPTCTDGGYTLYECSRCLKTMKVDRNPLGHNYVISQQIQPDCINEGYTRYTCSRCSDTYDVNRMPALGHNYEDTRIEPTCEEDGNITSVCSRCGDTHIKILPKHGHHYTLTDGIDATYNTEGYGTYTCDYCGDQYTSIIPVKGFNMGSEVEVLNANLYPTPLSDFVQCTKSGKFYCWYDRVENNRVKVARTEINCGVAGLITGWIDTNDVGRVILGEEGVRFRQGDGIHMLMASIYATQSSRDIIAIKTGLFYIAAYRAIDGRVPIVDKEEDVGHQDKILGWVPLDSIIIYNP